MPNQNRVFNFVLKISSVIGFAAMALPLYLYPLATIDPMDARPFYASPDYFLIYVPYAVVFFFSSFLVACGKRNFIFLLLLGFIASHFNFILYFDKKIVLKPAFAAVFIVIPTVIFLVAAFGVLMARTGNPRRTGS